MMDDFGFPIEGHFDSYFSATLFDSVAWRMLYFFGMQYTNDIFDGEVFDPLDNVV